MGRKVSVVGAGNVGSAIAEELARRNVAEEIVLIDVVEGFAAGKALDMAQAAPVVGFSATISGHEDLKVLAGSDVVVVTAGARRKPGMSRAELLSINAGVVSGVSKEIKKHAPKAVVILVTNPLDVMCYAAMKATGFPRERVMGMAGVLDAARMACFVAMELGISPVDVRAMVLGGHGDSMVPLVDYTTVYGIPVSQLIEAERIEAIVDRTRKGGGEIVSLLQTLSAFYAPGAGAAKMVEAVLTGKAVLVPASVWAEGEYGLKDTFVGLPVIIGEGGLKTVVELPLKDKESEALKRSAAAVKAGIETLNLNG
ncbi:MAG: malate dehydrogenase [Planctomycetota bacterium]|jgi:malate dehydrogenase